MTTELNTKKEIINEVIRISEYLLKHRLGMMYKSEATWNTCKKEDLLDIRNKMLDVISVDMRNKSRAYGNPNIPEIETLEEERVKVISDLVSKNEAIESDKQDEIADILKTQLGEGFEYDISKNSIIITILASLYLKLTITMRLDHNMILVNQPTFGSWDPIENNNGVRKFFSALYTISTNKDNWISDLTKRMIELYDICRNSDTEYNECNDTYMKKMKDITDKKVREINF